MPLRGGCFLFTDSGHVCRCHAHSHRGDRVDHQAPPLHEKWTQLGVEFFKHEPRFEVMEDGNFVGASVGPPQFVEAAQHPVGTLTAVVAGAHTLRPILVRLLDQRPRRSHCHQVTASQLASTAEHDLLGMAMSAGSDLGKPNALSIGMGA